MNDYPSQPHPSYHLSEIDQFQAEPGGDLVPRDEASREAYARMLAMDATIYGLPSVYQYVQMHNQAVDRASPTYTGFDEFDHQRDVATPDFHTFRTPNVDTLYSNAWLDLTGGPCSLHIPPIGDRYYTLHFLDLYANATNLSSRTVGPDGGDFLVVPPGWDGSFEPGVTVFRVGSPYMWILMRILVGESESDLQHVRQLQDNVTLRPHGAVGTASFLPITQAAAEEQWSVFFAVLDWTIRHGGHPSQEDAYTYRFRTLGVGHPDGAFDRATIDDATQRGIAAGFDDAYAVVRASRFQVGERCATGWATGTAGEPGFNYLRRAVQNFVGTGGNVTAEKKFFATFSAESGAVLDGSTAGYSVRLAPPPPSAHWSLTAYPTPTGLLYANEIDRYAIAPTTPGLEYGDDGSLTILLQHEPPPNQANWLPVPAEEFYVDLRTWEPDATVRDGTWLPGPVLELGGPGLTAA